MAALARTYFASAAFARLAAATKPGRRGMVEELIAAHGNKSVVGLEAKHVRALVAARGHTPGQARNLLSAISALMGFAVDIGIREDNPCRGIRRPKLSQEGWHGWTDEQIEIYRGFHAYGTTARLAFELALCSMQRRSDLVKLGRQHLKAGLLTVASQQKTGAPAFAAVSLELETALLAMPASGGPFLNFLLTHDAAPFTPAGLATRFSHWCAKAGLSNCPLHGLRKAGARLAVEAGCNVTEVAAIGGWKTISQLQRYIESYSRQQAARSAGEKIRTATLSRTQPAQNSHTEKKA
jgi:site-specific recombinase XerD